MQENKLTKREKNMVHTHYIGKITALELQTCVAYSVIKFDISGSPSKNSEDHWSIPYTT